MAISPIYPVILQNGTIADATQVMADFYQIQNDVNANAAHNGANSDITSLAGLTTPLPISEGGTGGSTQATALANLGAANSGVNTNITSLTGLTTPLAVSEGGTAGTSASATTANNIGAAALGANSDITSLSGLTTPLPITEGGTGAADVADALTNLGINLSGIAKAWVTFTGTTGGILKSFNIASLVRNSTGVYTITFATPMADSNYGVLPGIMASGGGAGVGIVQAGNTVSSFAIHFSNSSTGGSTDPTVGFLSIFD